MSRYVRTATADYKRLSIADLSVIDDAWLFPAEKSQAVALFMYFNQLYENTSFKPVHTYLPFSVHFS